jgi:hypothetical protein
MYWRFQVANFNVLVLLLRSWNILNAWFSFTDNTHTVCDLQWHATHPKFRSYPFDLRTLWVSHRWVKLLWVATTSLCSGTHQLLTACAPKLTHLEDGRVPPKQAKRLLLINWTISASQTEVHRSVRYVSLRMTRLSDVLTALEPRWNTITIRKPVNS